MDRIWFQFQENITNLIHYLTTYMKSVSKKFQFQTKEQ